MIARIITFADGASAGIRPEPVVASSSTDGRLTGAGRAGHCVSYLEDNVINQIDKLKITIKITNSVAAVHF